MVNSFWALAGTLMYKTVQGVIFEYLVKMNILINYSISS